MRQVKADFDVVVCGGGLAGVCAAIAAARTGAQTCIVQDRPVFGGNSSSEIRVFPQGAANYHAYARETGIISELLAEERAINHEPNHNNGRVNSVWDMILYDKVVSTPYLSFYLNTSVYDVRLDDRRNIRAVKARTSNAETELELAGHVFIDCTGDGVVAHLAGCEWRMGTEGRDEFGEPHAPLEASADVMGSSIHFRAKDLGRPVPFRAPLWAHKYDDPDVLYKAGRIPDDPEGGYWWIELSVPWNTITDNETIRHELTRHVLGIWDFIKNKDAKLMKKAENYALDWIGQVPGKRESRRVMGRYLLTELDLLNQTVFEDEVAYGGWFVDLHKAGGLLAEYSEQASLEGPDSEYMKRSYAGPYGIPLRCMLAKDVPNLMLAGRNISVTHSALGSTRVMGTTALLGQASGTAAALAIKKGMDLETLAKEKIFDLQQQLIRDGCFLLHTENRDEFDLACLATVTASSEALLVRAEPDETYNSFGKIEEDMLTEMRGQWIALGSDRIDAISVYVSNLSSETQWIDVALTPVDHIWDYRIQPHAELAKCRLAIPAGRNQWIRWELDILLPLELRSRYARLDLGPNPNIAWHRSKDVVPGMVAAYDLGTGQMARLGNAMTLAFAIEPAQFAYSPISAVSGAARPYRWTNMWRSDPAETMPQWIELSWDNPVEISLIQVTFSDQLLRDYRFCPPLHRNPECVKDFSVQAWGEGGWCELLRETDNYQSLRRFELPAPVSTDKLRIVILATNGDPSAVIGEIRVYPHIFEKN